MTLKTFEVLVEGARIGFPAEIEGVFEVEMHRFTDDGQIEIASLEVTKPPPRVDFVGHRAPFSTLAWMGGRV